MSHRHEGWFVPMSDELYGRIQMLIQSFPIPSQQNDTFLDVWVAHLDDERRQTLLEGALHYASLLRNEPGFESSSEQLATLVEPQRSREAAQLVGRYLVAVDSWPPGKRQQFEAKLRAKGGDP